MGRNTSAGSAESNAKVDAAKERKTTTTITAHLTNSRHVKTLAVAATVDPLACMHVRMQSCVGVCVYFCCCNNNSWAWPKAACFLTQHWETALRALLLGICPTTFVCTFRLRFIYYALLLIFAISHLHTHTQMHTHTYNSSSQQLHPLTKQKRLFCFH